MRIISIRVDIKVIVDIWSNLVPEVEHDFAAAYAYGRKLAAEETGLPLQAFPDTCLWTLEQVLTAPLDGPLSPFGEA